MDRRFGSKSIYIYNMAYLADMSFHATIEAGFADRTTSSRMLIACAASPALQAHKKRK